MGKQVILTGDRPSGRLHLGHYVGSLESRIALQDEYTQFIMIADMQALTACAETPEVLKENILQVALDYLAVGIDPKKSVIFIQSFIPSLSELFFYFLNLVTWQRVQHNPTVKEEIRQKGFKEGVPAGFVLHPISQAADIAALKTSAGLESSSCGGMNCPGPMRLRVTVIPSRPAAAMRSSTNVPGPPVPSEAR